MKGIRISMTINLFQTPEYKILIREHLTKSIEYMFSKNQEFALACEVKHITFSPELPVSLKETFNETVLFILSGYTFESATLEEDTFIFEAGFGSENFGSTVHVPLLAIKQMFLDDHPIVINMAEHTNIQIKHEKAKNNSMKSLLNNPENKKLLKKKR